MSCERTEQREARIAEVLARRQPGLTVVMENIHDPHNVSAILRTCDAVGVFEVNLLYNTDPFPDLRRTGKKSSSGARKWVEARRHTTAEECYASLRGRGFRIFASRLSGQSRPLYDLDLTGNVALVFGNEHRGVSDEAAEHADGLFQVPMVGMVQSLNVSVAAAVTLYEAFRQRHAAGLYGTPALTAEELGALRARWREK